MLNAKGQEIQTEETLRARLAEISKRHQDNYDKTKTMMDMLPLEAKKQVSLQYLTDMSFLLTYINAMHNMVNEMAQALPGEEPILMDKPSDADA